jgi:hypothetical protein
MLLKFHHPKSNGGYNKFTRVCEASVLFTIFIEIRVTGGKLTVGSFGSTEAANC